ncbi:glycerate kinase [Desulfohalobiaceae bacterium Ax17]|uniref:glycerate kinase type-2 family protein n=1 Tax=Desulfovulcanus ferrireducens TaxID=2831190 RepID=UPI00207BABC8|nr:glycerate kinase [Desulfovulcanus ferrireducens]MBT8763991.1 glycerate kinase [Desulfovulcanus ferrireducens]
MYEKRLRQHASHILAAALKSVQPQAAISGALNYRDSQLKTGTHYYALNTYKKIVAIGAGKAGAAMAVAVESLLGERLNGGLVVVKDAHTLPTKKIRLLEAAHPVPDERSIRAGQEILAFVDRHRSKDTLFFFLLSGGASSLLVAPAPGITLEDKQKVTRLLLASGANIQEINAIRKHLSQIKGGRLARHLHPSTTISLIISDVVGDRLDVIGSGPTAADSSSWADCHAILTRYDLWDKLPESVQQLVLQGLKGIIPDTPFSDEECFKNVSHHIIASNRQALLAAARAASSLGYAPLILSSSIEGETKDIARVHVSIAKEILESGHPMAPPCCVISGGETTVSLGESYGLGGRNQEFALSAALELEGLKNVLILSAGTDGTDGPTDAAGAMVTGSTTARAKKLNLDARKFLHEHDAYTFFNRTRELIITGPTLTNVMDIHLVLVGQRIS